MVPHVVTTQQLRTLVSPTRPTFSAKAVREGVQESGQHRRQAVGGQAAGQVGRGQFLAHHLGHDQHVGRGLGVGDQHDDAHRDDRRRLELRMPESEEAAEADPLGRVNAGEVQRVHRPGDQRADRDRQQHRDPAVGLIVFPYHENLFPNHR
jgi:hypothetical protein